MSRSNAAFGIDVVDGERVRAYLPELARLRIAVFRGWPYCYDGNEDYERRYLETYGRSQRSVFVLARNADTIVGASSGIPLADEEAAIRRPFDEAGIAIGDVFYFGESVLMPSHRGLGIGHRFFDEREAFAHRHGFAVTAFCSVVRNADDPRRPPGYRSNDAFWRKRGYLPQPSMRCRLSWTEIGDSEESTHELVFWLRDWRDAS